MADAGKRAGVAKLVHQVVTTYQDNGGNITGVCACGKAYPLQAGVDPNATTMSMHISLQNRNEAIGI